MKKYLMLFVTGLSFIALPHLVHATVLDDLIANYQSTSGKTLDAKSGEALWKEKHAQARSCGSCHGDNLRNIGKHIKTKKRIKPMAPSVNKKRFTKTKFIEKWFKRNCQWTWGRACTAAEKGQILMFLKTQ